MLGLPQSCTSRKKGNCPDRLLPEVQQTLLPSTPSFSLLCWSEGNSRTAPLQNWGLSMNLLHKHQILIENFRIPGKKSLEPSVGNITLGCHLFLNIHLAPPISTRSSWEQGGYQYRICFQISRRGFQRSMTPSPLCHGWIESSSRRESGRSNEFSHWGWASGASLGIH